MNWRAIHALSVRNTKRFLRDPTEIFWTIIFPILLMVMTAYIFIPPEGGSIVTLKLGIVNLDKETNEKNFTAITLIEIFNKTEIDGKKLFDVRILTNLSKGIELLKKGELDVVLLIPRGFTKNITYTRAYLYTYISSADPHLRQIAYAEMSTFFSILAQRTSNIRLKFIKEYSVKYVPPEYHKYLEEFFKYLEYTIEPINVTYEYVKPTRIVDRASILGWQTIGLIGIMVMYSGFFSGALALISEKEKGTLRKLLVAPITANEIYLATVIDALFSSMCSAVIAIVFAVGILGARLYWEWSLEFLLMPLLFILAILHTVSIGILLSLASKSERGASGFVSAIAFPLIFITGIWLPRWMLPKPLQTFTYYFPLTNIVDAIRDIVVYGKSLIEILHYIPIPIITTIILAVIGYIIFKKRAEKFLVG